MAKVHEKDWFALIVKLRGRERIHAIKVSRKDLVAAANYYKCARLAKVEVREL